MEPKLIRLTDIETRGGELIKDSLFSATCGVLNRVFIPLGTSLPRHTSPVSAWLQVITGGVRVELEDSAWTVNPGEMLFMPAGHAHQLTPLADSIVLVTKFMDA